MADITKCKGTYCPIKESCYRFTAQKSELQSYFLESPIKENGKCDMYRGLTAEEAIWNKLKKIVKISYDPNRKSKGVI